MLDDIENEGAKDEDEMLLSFDNEDADSLKKKLKAHQKQEVATLRARVIHLESLLSANLETMST